MVIFIDAGKVFSALPQKVNSISISDKNSQPTKKLPQPNKGIYKKICSYCHT